MTFGLPALLSAVFVATPLFAAPAATMPTTSPTTLPSAEVTELVTRLLGDDVADRTAARQALLNAGENALPGLQSARAAAIDPEAQLQLDTLLVQVKERADVGATRVTLQFSGAPLDVVLQSLGQQARADFGGENFVNEMGGRDAMPAVTLDLRDVTFWRAIQEIQTAAGVLFIPQGDAWRVTRNGGQQSFVRGTETGAFLVQPTMASYQRTISYQQNVARNGEDFSFTFQTLCEPKVKLAGGMGTVTLDRAVDSNGNDLIGAQRVIQVGTGNGQNAIHCQLRLRYPKNAGDMIAEIRGTMRFSLARRTDVMTSDDLLGARRVESSLSGVRIIVDAMADENVPGGLSTTVTIAADGDAAAAQRLQQNFHQQVRITDAKGMMMRLTSSNQVRSDAGGSEFRFTYTSPLPQRTGGPYKLRIEVPTGFRELEVPFSMRDMKMP